MPYTVKQLAKLAGISVRTLHHYDAVGLLKPARVEKNGYRQYEEQELLQLQQILFFRELEFPLDEIKRVMSSPHFDMRSALNDQRHLIELKKKRLIDLIKTIDKTLKKLNQEIIMDDKDLYDGLSDEKMKEYTEEAKQRWGHTEAWKQSQERYAKMSKDDIKKLKENADTYMKIIASHVNDDPKSEQAQELIAQHYQSLRTWYEPNLEMYRGLAQMYVDDPRFAAYYEKYAPGLAVWMREAMLHYAEKQSPSGARGTEGG